MKILSKKILSLLFISLFFLCYENFYCQSKFQMVIGGNASEWGRDMIRTTDNGYAIAATTTSFGANSNDVYIVKLNSSFVIQWTKIIGGSGMDNGYSIVQANDGGYVVSGETYTFGAGAIDIYIVKVNASGNLQWTKTIGGNQNDASYTLCKTSDGGYLVLGYTYSFGQGNSDGYAVKIDADGNLQWARTIGGPNHDVFTSAVQDPDGSYVITGSTKSYGAGNDDVYIVKLSSGGSLIWAKTVGGANDDRGFSIVKTYDGGYVISQTSNSYGAGGWDLYIVKINSTGDLLWTKTVGGSNNEFGYPLIQTADSGFAIAGQTNSFGFGNDDAYVVKLNKSGILQWTKVIGGNSNDYAFSIFQTTDGGYVIGGITGSYGAGNDDIYLIKLDNTGSTCNNSLSGGTSGSGGTLNSGGVIGSGGNTGTGGSVNANGGILTMLCVVGINNISSEIPDEYKLYQNYPNPFNPTTKIRFDLPHFKGGIQEGYVSLTIYNSLGQIVDKQTITSQPGTYEYEWDGTNYPSGVYFYQLTTGDASAPLSNRYSESRKMILIK